MGGWQKFPLLAGNPISLAVTLPSFSPVRRFLSIVRRPCIATTNADSRHTLPPLSLLPQSPTAIGFIGRSECFASVPPVDP